MKRQKLLTVMGLVMALVAFSPGIFQGPAEALDIAPNGYYVPDYFLTANWANSPALAKFVDTLAPLGCTTPNNLGQCIPIAVPDTTTYSGSDYYEIELVEYRERMHTGFPALNNVDKILATSGGTKLRGYRQINHPGGPQAPNYLGPIIVASKYDSNYAPGAALPGGGINGKPVRIKFTNSLPTGTGGDLFLPTDTTIMGSGSFEINYDPITKQPITLTSGTFTQNRATLHLHGGRSPWISDGTAHQWITPATETTAYSRGVSAQNVPDMPDPGAGSQTFYWTNQQSSRLMFYHDHAMGITRLNVYAGEAAGYILRDPVEQALINGGTINGRAFAVGTIPAAEIPLIIQDKTFVDATTIMTTDPTWAWGSNPGQPVTATPVTGDLWWPHVYMPAQNPYNPNMSGINDFGRWHYGPWFFPATPLCFSAGGTDPEAVKPYCIENGPVANPYANPANPNYSALQPPEIPGTPNPSWGAEAFLDTMMVNGTVYPTVALAAQPYRLRVLNASHDRVLNLQLYKASPIVSGITLTGGGSGYTSAPAVIITGVGTGATATATVDLDSASPNYGQVIDISLDTVGSGYTVAPTVTFSGGGGTGATATAAVYTALTEVGMVPAAMTSGFPGTWPADGREGGVPDPATKGPAMIQIGSEGGFLPGPVVLPNQPVQWNLDPTMFNVGNVLNWADGGGTLFLAPAERADVIVDFSNYAGQTLILYNDAPTAFPALDPHYDYYTGAPGRTDIGGYNAIPPGVGPNIRTVMQITIAGTGGTAPADDYNPATLAALETAFASDATTPGVFESSQEQIVVGQSAYNTVYNTTFPATWPNWGLSRISDSAISFQQVDGTPVSNFLMKPKAIQDEMGETFDDYGRMSAKLGLEVPFVNGANQNFILQNFVDPPTEYVKPGEVQVWRITHNGVDTHPIHFHLFDVQLINRVGWDGFIRLPDPTELGWKDTVRVSPLEDTIVALRPVAPITPFALPESVRPLNPTTPIGSTMGFSQLDTTDGADLIPLLQNQMFNFGWEYTWHCHILSHEENDMMRAVAVRLIDHIGVFRNGEWYMELNGNGAWDAGIDRFVTSGITGDLPVVGDWDGNGSMEKGVFNNGTWTIELMVEKAPTTYSFGAGLTGASPVTGDWTGTGDTKIGVYADGVWYIDLNGDGAWNGTPTDAMYSFGVGLTGAQPVTGDWNGNGTTKIGLYVDGAWYLDVNGNGAWDGTPTDAVYSFGGGLTGAVPVAGDWNGSGTSKIGVYVDGTWYLDVNGNGAWDGTPTDATSSFGVGLTGSLPVVSKW